MFARLLEVERHQINWEDRMMSEHETDADMSREQVDEHARRIAEQRAREQADQTARRLATAEARRHGQIMQKRAFEGAFAPQYREH